MLKRLLLLLLFMVTVSLPPVAFAEGDVQTPETPEFVANNDDVGSASEGTVRPDDGVDMAEESAETVALTRSAPVLITDENARCNAATLGSYGEGVQLWAVWKPKVYNCGAGYYLQKSENSVDCAVCPKDSYCPGVDNYEYEDSEHGREPCPAGYITERTGSSVKHSCYKTETVQCKEKNPYTGEHIVEVVYDAVASNCTHYYGRDSVCDSSCEITGLVCEEGYKGKLVDGVWKCVELTVDCAAGTYLSGESGRCEECREDSYCAGGTYSVEAKQDIGIVSCEDGLKAPRGSRAAVDCGVILRIGGDALYLHSDKRGPSLVVQDSKGRVWYANATPVSTDGAKKVSEGATKELHVMINGEEYTVHTSILE